MFQWVRSNQAGGGHSLWHLLHSRRRGQRTWPVPAPGNRYAIQSGLREFALTACGFDFDEFQIQPATRPLRGGNVLVWPSSRAALCTGCSNFVRQLVTTTDA